ncbi:hypothetical protein PHYSODRAFT_330004 [Phytophthora sojae]|uniref:Uncharacterized protein n=1 Tax=Phytophthora sojae (strain P6497) TaxID=1094619 RepID=G4ZCC7_PHYSP|nr:hypothetical protein PHYSODRAFT_330004 [Phytophthora sojae]EGZ22155.1 hypothetical protein PHYSODRAFT_330004 [Phytophthora sojae]|eukprot:XP_009524872.1 hypothetical protein PHYSODRAFT_330004 [Phytophthora sojae]
MNQTEEDTVHVYREEDGREDEELGDDEEDQIDEIRCHASVIRVLPSEHQALEHVVQQIQAFFMTMEEAIMEAARTGDVQWLEKLVEDDCYNVWDAAVVGAKNGDIDAAAEHGHCGVIDLACPVERLDPYKQPPGSLAKHRSDTLSAAVVNGHAHVVDLLLDPYEYHWDIGKALDDAIRVDNKPLMERLYRAYPEFVQGDWYERNAPASMLGEAAQEGHLNAVKYLIERGHDSLEDENRAFIRAARGNCVETMALFRDRGRISVETLNKAFILAAYFGSTEAVMFLHEKESISPESIAAGFELAASNVSYCYRGPRVTKEQEVIMRFMCSNGLVPPDLFSEVFLSAASNDKANVLKSLQVAQTIPSELATQALMGAAQHFRLKTLWYVQQSHVVGGRPTLSPELCSELGIGANCAGKAR